MNPRSIAEIEFAASLRPCAACGKREPLAWHSSGGFGEWRTHAVCPCGELRMYAYRSNADLRATKLAHAHLGGAEPSTIIEAQDLIAELELLAPKISATDTTSQNFAVAQRALVAANELYKLLRSDRARAKWAREQRERHVAIWRDLIAAERAVSGGRIEMPRYSPPPTLDRDSRQAHDAWLRRGRTGPGRLNVRGARVANDNFTATDATAGYFERTVFEANLSFSSFDEAELVDCTFDGSYMASAQFAGASFTRSSLDRVRGNLVNFAKARIDRCSFDDAALTESRWDDAVITTTSFAGAVFAAGSWQRARIQNCCFRGASWEPQRDYPNESMVDARFEDCDFTNASFANADLRGVTFLRCRFDGAMGAPRASEGMLVDGAARPTEDLLAGLLRVYALDELVANVSSIIVAADRVADAPLVVFQREGPNMRRIGSTRETVADLRAHGIESAVTYGTSGVVWTASEKSFRIWCRWYSDVEITRQELAWAAGQIATANITAVVSVAEPDDARCGVTIRTPSLQPTRLILVQSEGDRTWTLHLARDLAAWLRVPYIDRGQPADGWT